MNKINPFFSEISQQRYKIYTNVAIINQIWHRVKWYFTSMNNTLPIYCIKYDYNHHILFWDITINIQNLWKNCHNYLNLASLHALAGHGTWSWYQIWRQSIQSSWRNVQGTDRLTDRETDQARSYIPWFHYCCAGNNNIAELLICSTLVMNIHSYLACWEALQVRVHYWWPGLGMGP